MCWWYWWSMKLWLQIHICDMSHNVAEWFVTFNCLSKLCHIVFNMWPNEYLQWHSPLPRKFERCKLMSIHNNCHSNGYLFVCWLNFFIQWMTYATLNCHVCDDMTVEVIWKFQEHVDIIVLYKDFSLRSESQDENGQAYRIGLIVYINA